jgi:tetratricopeptide (TPR) repeat protein
MMKRNTIVILSSLVIFSLLCSGKISAEKITLTSGDVMDGTIITENEKTVTLKFGGSMIELDKKNIDSITPSIVTAKTGSDDTSPVADHDTVTEPVRQRTEVDIAREESEKFFKEYFGSKAAFEKAFQTIQERSQTDPDDLNNRYQLAICYYYLGQYKNALRELNTLYQKNKNDLEVILYLGHTYEKNGNLDNAITFFKKRIAARPADTRTRKSLAFCYSKRGDYPNALTEFETVFANDPNDVIVGKQLLSLYKKTGDQKGYDRIQQHLETNASPE